MTAPAIASALINPSAFGGPDADDPLTRVVVVVVVVVDDDALLLDDDPYVNLNAPSFDDDEGVAADDAPATVAALRDAGSVIFIFVFIVVVVVDTAPQMTRAAYLRPSHRLVPSPPPTLDARVIEVDDDDVNRVEHNDVTPLAPIIIMLLLIIALLSTVDQPTRRFPSSSREQAHAFHGERHASRNRSVRRPSAYDAHVHKVRSLETTFQANQSQSIDQFDRGRFAKQGATTHPPTLFSFSFLFFSIGRSIEASGFQKGSNENIDRNQVSRRSMSPRFRSIQKPKAYRYVRFFSTDVQSKKPFEGDDGWM